MGAVRCENGQIRTVPVRSPWNRTVAVRFLEIFTQRTMMNRNVGVLRSQSLRKRKILSTTELRANEFRSVAFSADSKYLATLGSAPDWTLIYWHWEKSKALASTHTGHPVSTGPIEQVLAPLYLSHRPSCIQRTLYDQRAHTEGSSTPEAMRCVASYCVAAPRGNASGMNEPQQCLYLVKEPYHAF